MMESLIADSVAQKASDLHLCSGCQPVIRVAGRLQTLSTIRLHHQSLNDDLCALLSTVQQQRFSADKQLDLAYQHAAYGRMRINLFFQQRGISAAIRFIRETIPTLAEINAPQIVYHLAEKKHGLILVTGATGSGKSTSLAAFIQHINLTQARHIVTLEDPIEFIYQNQQCLIQQREIGHHTVGFLAALTALLRQDPDIILIGELRDRETIQVALTLAETGHLVLASLHTHSAIAAISRLIEGVESDRRALVSTQLSQSLVAVLCQRLVPHPAGGRYAQHEVLINTAAVSHLIREGQWSQLRSLMQTGKQQGMQLMPTAD
ncbi:PilT/PilU family type 4a pilus ATPase [Utexia brackfieldae]|uniref:type IV pilus twitching motility protein PilT n=1 Tax=Utexia brackfieldae TaxID=3074108 RepID=UPI00370D13A3